jgi:hypothetical protein
MLHIQSNFRTPEKMALTLLDYLFDRDTQASSNISGMGKHGKKQLDPLFIYGIRCRYASSSLDSFAPDIPEDLLPKHKKKFKNP